MKYVNLLIEHLILLLENSDWWKLIEISKILRSAYWKRADGGYYEVFLDYWKPLKAKI